MKAITYTKYGSSEVLKFTEVEKPAPKENEVLVKVCASSANPLDWHFMRGKPLFMRLMGSGLLKPKVRILGADLAGRVEAVGTDIKNFAVGDEIYGAATSKFGFGGFAEYICIDETRIVHKPKNISFEEAAAAPVAAITALQGLQDAGQLKAGEKVLINGASGGVGTYAIQIAKAMGGEVTAVCSTRNVEQARELGADHVIDYTKEDFTQNGKRYDLIVVANGYQTLSEYFGSLAPKGRYVVLGGSLKQLFQAMLLGKRLAKKENKHISTVNTVVNAERLNTLSDLFESGKVKSIIERRYPLEETAEALKYVEEGHAQAKVVITMGANN